MRITGERVSGQLSKSLRPGKLPIGLIWSGLQWSSPSITCLLATRWNQSTPRSTRTSALVLLLGARLHLVSSQENTRKITSPKAVALPRELQELGEQVFGGRDVEQSGGVEIHSLRAQCAVGSNGHSLGCQEPERELCHHRSYKGASGD